MSAVIADPTAGAAPVKRGKKKLIIGAAALVLSLAIAGGAVAFLKHRAAQAAAAAGDDEAAAGEHATAGKVDAGSIPVYLPLDPFVVNLADKEADRYAQIGVTFELQNGGSAEQMKAYMPSIRNAILLILANKTSRELIDRAGKEQLAQEIMREAVRPMGIEVAAPEPISVAPMDIPMAQAASAAASGASAAASDAVQARPRTKRMAQKNPIQHVHFSSFIIQ